MPPSNNKYDFWINQNSTNPLGFNTYISKDHPYERSTADYRKEQINSAAGTGDTALTGWWTEGQLSFHGGEGLRFDSEWTPITDVRFDTGSSLDCYTAGYAKVGLATAAVTTLHGSYTSMSVMNSAGLVVAQGAAGTIDVIDQGGANTDNKTFSEFPVPNGTLTTHPGVAGDATAYIVTDNTIERCWHLNPPAPKIRQWATNPALAGNTAIVPFVADTSGRILKTTSSGGVTLSGSAGMIAVPAPEATVVHNLAPNPSFSTPGGNTQATNWSVSSPSSNALVVTATTATIPNPSGAGTLNNPISSTCGFIETVAPSASVPYVLSTTINLPKTGSGEQLNFNFKVAYTDAPSVTATASITWDVGGTSSTSINPGGATWQYDDASFPVPVGATTGTLKITLQPGASPTHTSGKGFYITDMMVSTDLSRFFSGTYAPAGMSAMWFGDGAECTSLATSGYTDRPVMITVRGATASAAGIQFPPLTYGATQSLPANTQTWTAGGIETLALTTKSVNGVALFYVSGMTSLSVVSVTDALKPALIDTTTAYSFTNWTWDGATNASTQTFTGSYFSEPLVWLPTVTNPAPGVVAPAFIGAWFAKQRLIALDNNGNWYQFSPSARHAAATADIFWTVPIEIANTSSPWSVHEGPDGVYITHDHRVWLANLDSTGSTGPAVTQVAAVANDEVIRDFAYYLGQLITVTDKGIRSGRLNLYGRLIIGPRFALGSYTACAPWDDTVLVSGTESVTGVSGVFAVSMVTDVDQNTTIPAWWNAWQGTPPLALGASVGSPSASWNPDGALTARPSFNAPMALSSTGAVQTLVANAATSGTLTTTRIRMGTLENKVFRYLTVRTSGTSGSVGVSAILPNGTVLTLGTIQAGSLGTFDIQAQANMPSGGAEYLQFKFTINGAASLTGWQVKAQPNPTRQRLIKVPLMLMDRESSIYGVTSYASAAKRMLALEALENSNAVVTYQDNTTGDSGTAYIESIEVTRLAPASQPTPAFGGIIQLTLRKA